MILKQCELCWDFNSTPESRGVFQAVMRCSMPESVLFWHALLEYLDSLVESMGAQGQARQTIEQQKAQYFCMLSASTLAVPLISVGCRSRQGRETVGVVLWHALC